MKTISASRVGKIAQIVFVGALVFLSAAHTASALTITPIKLELSANPGQVVSQDITLYNEQDTAQNLYVSYANFEATGENGNPTFVDAQDDLGTWMNAAKKVSIAAKSSQVVPLTINVPKDATPGGHFAAVFWGTVPPTGAGSQVAVSAKTGVLVLLSVSGNVSEDGGIIEYDTVDHSNFYTSLPVSFYYRFQNNGGDRIKPTGIIAIKNILGFTSARVPGNPVDGNVLPNSTRKITTTWQGQDGSTPPSDANQGNFFGKVGREWRNFAFGYYHANIALSYGVKGQISSKSIGLWVFPWHLLIVIIIVLFIVWFVGKKTIHHYNKWVIGKAQEMLKAEEAKEAQKKEK